MAKQITTSINAEFGFTTFSFDNNHPDMVCSLVGLSGEIINRLALLGLKNKVVDGAALPCDPATGRPAPLEQKIAAMTQIWDNLVEGRWGIIWGGGTGEPKGGYLFTALRELYAGRKTPEELKTFLASKDKKQQAQLRENPRVKNIIDRLKVEAASASGIDTDALLNELEG